MKRYFLSAALGCAIVSPAWAAPGLGSEVYGASVEKGEVEFETKWDTLAGGPDGGEDVIKLEAAYGVTDRLRLAVSGEIEQEPGFSHKAEELGIEAIYELGSAGGIDFALYGEYAIGLHGPDAVEAKLLVQHKGGPLDIRFNLTAEKHLESGEDVELEYAASADYEVVDEVRLGVQAFGELGTFDDFLPHSEHFLGPVAKFEIEGLGPELEIQAGYLFALDKAKDDTDGQFRLALELEF